MRAQSNPRELLRELRPHIIFALIRDGGLFLWVKLATLLGLALTLTGTKYFRAQEMRTLALLLFRWSWPSKSEGGALASDGKT
jgi:hypothetical protein